MAPQSLRKLQALLKYDSRDPFRIDREDGISYFEEAFCADLGAIRLRPTGAANRFRTGESATFLKKGMP